MSVKTGSTTAAANDGGGGRSSARRTSTGRTSGNWDNPAIDEMRGGGTGAGAFSRKAVGNNGTSGNTGSSGSGAFFTGASSQKALGNGGTSGSNMAIFSGTSSHKALGNGGTSDTAADTSGDDEQAFGIDVGLVGGVDGAIGPAADGA